MAAEPSAPDSLAELLEKHSARAKQYASELPLLRAAAQATSDRLAELAATPPGSPLPRRTYVDVVLAAPSREWAENVRGRLSSKLPDAQVNLGPSGTSLRDAPPPSHFVVRCEISWRGQPHPGARDAVRSALASMDDVEVDYNEPIDLVVVTPASPRSS